MAIRYYNRQKPLIVSGILRRGEKFRKFNIKNGEAGVAMGQLEQVQSG
jgi:hypothetical protein